MLVSKKTVRLDHPKEPGQWIEIRTPLSAGDMELMRNGNLVGMVTLDLMAAVIVAWSVPEPVTVENVKLLDLDTFQWLASEVMERSGVLDDEEKKDSNAASSPTTPPAEDSPPLSGI